MMASRPDPAIAPSPKKVRVLMFDASAAQASFWFDAFNVVLVIGAVLVAMGTYGSIRMGAVKERFADDRISAAERDAAVANQGVESAKADAARANESAERLKNDNLNLETGLVEAQQRLEAERAERLRLEESVGPRRLTPEQQGGLVAALKAIHPSPNVHLMLIGDQEAHQYGQAILGAFEEARVQGKADAIGMMVPPPYGVKITTKRGHAAGAAVEAAFKVAKIPTSIGTGDPGEYDAEILVGLRPLGPR